MPSLPFTALIVQLPNGTRNVPFSNLFCGFAGDLVHDTHESHVIAIIPGQRLVFGHWYSSNETNTSPHASEIVRHRGGSVV